MISIIYTFGSYKRNTRNRPNGSLKRFSSNYVQIFLTGALIRQSYEFLRL